MHIKNNDTVNHVWVGQLVTPGAYYQIQDFERLTWANNSPFVKDIANSLGVMAYDNTGSGDILSINEGINYLKEIPTPTLPDYSDIFYGEVESESEESSVGVVIPNGQTIGVLRFKGNGQDPSAFIMLVYDKGGVGEKIFGVIMTDADTLYDTSLPYAQVTGNGVASLQIVSTNNSTKSATIGGLFEAVILM